MEFVPRGCGEMEGDPTGYHQEVGTIMILSVAFCSVLRNRRRL